VAFYALSFALFGCFTPEAIIFTFLHALLLSLFTTLFVYRIGDLFLGSRNGGLLAALLFAVGPVEAQIFALPTQLDFNIHGFFLTLILLCALEFQRARGQGQMLALASSSALGALVHPVLLLCGAFCVAFSWMTSKASRGTGLLVIFAVVQLVILAPYLVYQRLALGEWVLIKSNARFELYLGNTKTAGGILNNSVFQSLHPSQNVEEFQAYRDIGELAYVDAKYAEFLKEFELASFIENSLRRFMCFFFVYNVQEHDSPGPYLVAKRLFSAVPGMILVAYLLVHWRILANLDGFIYGYIGLFSLPYMFTANMLRYALPILPCATVLLTGILLRVIRVMGISHPRSGGM
jgi:hypothetical protein